MDARDFPLRRVGATARDKEHEERRGTLADHYYAAFSAYPDVLLDIQEKCFLSRTTVEKVEWQVDPLSLPINEGKRQACLDIMQMVREGHQGKATGDPPRTTAAPPTEGDHGG